MKGLIPNKAGALFIPSFLHEFGKHLFGILCLIMGGDYNTCPQKAPTQRSDKRLTGFAAKDTLPPTLLTGSGKVARHMDFPAIHDVVGEKKGKLSQSDLTLQGI